MTTPGLPLEQIISKSRRVGSGERFQYLHSRPETFNHWNQESLDAAITAVEVDGVSIRRAAVLYSIPKSTLNDHVSGRVARLAKPGPKPYILNIERRGRACKLPS